jgi:hypothetical protein
MSVLDDYYTENELAELLKKKTGKGSKRGLRGWRQRRTGPPWAYLGRNVIYPKPGFGSWLRDQVQQPVRARRRSIA